MHISKFLAVICVSALGTTSLLAQRPDNDVQSRARQQLREAMGELNGQPATNAAPTQPVKPAPAPAQPAVTQPKPVAQPPPVATPAPVVKPMPATTATPAPAMQPKTLSPEAEAKARAALHQAEGTQWPTAAQTKPMPTGTGTMMTPAPVATKPTAGKPVFANTPAMQPEQLAPPAPKLSGTKQQRLDQLLQQYKMDQINPEAYHKERAKILAEP